MKQVIEELKTGRVSVVETPPPLPERGGVLVRTRASLISPGTERMLIEMGKRSILGKAAARPDLVRLALQKAKREGFFNVFREAMARLDQPLPLGYSAAGEVIAVGEGVRGIRVGDRVACAGQGIASHAQTISVPGEFYVRMPTGRNEISFEEGSFVMLGGIALQGVRCGEISFGETVVVVGLGLIGLITVQLLKAYGCAVIGVDVNNRKIELARKVGCDRVLNSATEDVEGTVLSLTNGHGADVVLLTAATKDNSPILLAESIARRRGRIVLVGVSDLKLTRKNFWDKELLFTVSKASGPTREGLVSGSLLPPEYVRWTEKRNLEEFIRLLAERKVDVKSLITHRYSVEDADQAYQLILGGKQPFVGVILEYRPETTPSTPRSEPHEVQRGSAAPAQRQSVGFVGAGLFTKNFLIPAFSEDRRCSFVGVAAKTGVSAAHVAKKFGFHRATTDYRELLADGTIGSIVVTTRHNLHGPMVLDALKVGKHVFVEKPLCITSSHLHALEKAYSSMPEPVLVFVGFNRRYSPLVVRLKGALAKRSGPLVMNYRVNAGYVPADHWTQDPAVGGGRIIGEVCHFIDLMQFLSSADPVQVVSTPIGQSTGRYFRDDNVAVTVTFEDGSLGTIVYTALGTKMFSRERLEVFSGETVSVLEDFRSLEIVRTTGRTKHKLWNQDMGYRAEVQAYFDVPPSEFEERFRDAVLTTRATFAAIQSLRSGKPVTVREARWEG